MTQFTCKGVKQINNRISFKHHYHSYLSAFFISAGVPNGEFPEILIAKCRSRFYCTVIYFFVGGRSCGRKRCVREIIVSRAWDPVHAGDKALTWETPTKRGRVNRYALHYKFTQYYGGWNILYTCWRISLGFGMRLLLPSSSPPFFFSFCRQSPFF
jgi:hypothetical protein